jgi:hypothetical protein
MQSQKQVRRLVGQATFVALTLALLVAPVSARGQQTYVTRFDAFTGYTFLDSPHVSLFENGFHFQAGVRPTSWYSIGFDYSISAGDLTLTSDLLTTRLQELLGTIVSPVLARGAGSFPNPNHYWRSAIRLPALLQADTLYPAFDQTHPGEANSTSKSSRSFGRRDRQATGAFRGEDRQYSLLWFWRRRR